MDLTEKILFLVGSKGMSRTQLIEKKLVKMKFRHKDIRAEFAELKKKEILEMNVIKPFSRNRGMSYMVLTKKGKDVYNGIFKQKPTISEAEKLRRDHDNLVHGYSIFFVSELLKKVGYKNITDKREDNIFKIGLKHSYISDINAFNPKTNKQEYFEIEVGTYSREGFKKNKLVKIGMILRDLIIIVPNQKTKEKLEGFYNEWKSDVNTVVNIDFMTLYELKCMKKLQA